MKAAAAAVGPLAAPLGALVLAFALAGGAVAAPLDEQALAGRKLAQDNCAECHAIGARGKSPNRAAPRFRDLHKRYAPGALETLVAEGVLTRSHPMPKFLLSEEDEAGLVAYLKAIQPRR